MADRILLGPHSDIGHVCLVELQPFEDILGLIGLSRLLLHGDLRLLLEERHHTALLLLATIVGLARCKIK